MKYSFSLFAVAAAALCLSRVWAEPPTTAAPPSAAAAATPPSLFPQLNDGRSDLQGGWLDGQGAVYLASGRAPSKTAYLIYAAALDRYAMAKAELLKGEPVLQRYLNNEFKNAYNSYKNYSFEFHDTEPVRDAKSEAHELEAILAGGYKGMLADEIKSYAVQLEATGEPAPQPVPEMQWGRPARLRLGLLVDGSKLTFAFQNDDAAPVKLMTHVQAGDERQYDGFALLAINSKMQVHEFDFTAPRGKGATPVYQTVAKGGSYSDTIDLSKWYNRQGSGIAFGYEETWTLVLVYRGDKTTKGGELTPPLYSGAVRAKFVSGSFTPVPASLAR